MAAPRNNYIRAVRLVVSFFLFPFRFLFRSFVFLRRFRFRIFSRRVQYFLVPHAGSSFWPRKCLELWLWFDTRRTWKKVTPVSASGAPGGSGGKKVIAFSLWGTNKRYTRGLLRNIELAATLFPGWSFKVYHSTCAPSFILERAKHIGPEVELIPCGRAEGHLGAVWRYYAADSDDIVIFRDCDGRLTERDKALVDAWLASCRDFHIVHDVKANCWDYLIPGGAWGVRRGVLKGISKFLKKWRGSYFASDEIFLLRYVVPLFRQSSVFIHRWGASSDEAAYQAVARRMFAPGFYDYVGCAYDHEDNPIYYVDDDGLLRALAERRDRKFFEENLGSPASDKDGKPSRRAQSSI